MQEASVLGYGRGGGVFFIWMGSCVFLALEGKDRGFVLHRSSALPHTLCLELAVGEMHVQG